MESDKGDRQTERRKRGREQSADSNGERERENDRQTDKDEMTETVTERQTENDRETRQIDGEKETRQRVERDGQTCRKSWRDADGWIEGHRQSKGKNSHLMLNSEPQCKSSYIQITSCSLKSINHEPPS